MNKWLKHCLLELRLVLGNPVLALFPVIYGALFLVFAFDTLEYIDSEVYKQLIQYHSVAHTISLGPAMMLGILMVRRDIRRPSYEWNRSLPVSFSMLLSTKYVVGFLYMTLFTIPTSIIFYVLSVGQGVDGSIALRHTMDIVVQAEVSYLVTLALAMLLAVCIPNRVVYLIGFCAWMFGTFFMDIFLIEQAGLSAIKTFHLSQFFLITAPLGNESWGYELFRGELNQSRMFVLAFTLLMLIVSLLLLNRTRPTMTIKWCWLSVSVAVILSIVAFVPYASMWQERYAAIREIENDPSIRLAETDFSKDKRLTISSYDITLQRNKGDILVLSAKLEVPNKELGERTSFPLTLHRTFQVSKVLVQGIDTTFRRQGDHLNVEIPNEVKGNLQVEIFYSGRMMNFLKRYNSERYPAFSIGTEVNLPKSMAWYPLPGHQDVYVEDYDPSRIYTGFYYSAMYFPPADMKLRVRGYSNPLYTGIPELARKKGYQEFEGKEVKGLTLLGSRDWLELKHENLPITLVTTPYNRRYSQEILRDLNGKYEYFSRWIPEFKPGITHIMYLGTGVDGSDEHKKVDNEMILSLTNFINDPSTDGLSGDWMNTILFGGQEGLNIYTGSEETAKDVRGKISSLFWYLYYREAGGLSNEEIVDQYGWKRSIQLLTMKDKDYDPKGIGRKMLKQVSKALDQGKEREVKELLLHFYNKGISQPGRRENMYLNEQAVSMDEWNREWDKVVGSPHSNKKK